MARLATMSTCAMAIVTELLALAMVVSNQGLMQLAALALHLLSVVLVMWMPRTARKVGRRQTELTIDGLITLCVPLLGSVQALWSRTTYAERYVHAERVMREFHEEVLESHEMEPTRSPFTGVRPKDFAMLCDAESFEAVLAHGTSDHKRNALRKLAHKGEPQHMALLRQCLEATDSEVALFAYAQLSQAEDAYLARISDAETAHDEKGGNVETLAAVVRAHRELALSGVLDPASARWHAEVALAKQAHLGSPALSSMADSESDVTSEDQQVEHLLEAAREAIRTRNFQDLSAIQASIKAHNIEVPVWLDFATAAGTEQVA